MSVTIVTGEVRLSYVNVFTPKTPQSGGDPVYSVTVLIPKSDIATKQALDNAIQQVLNEELATTFKGIRPPNPSAFIHDGDGTKPTTNQPYGDECKGHWVISVKSKTKPEVVDENVQPIITPTSVYSGCYGRVSLNIYAYSNVRTGIGCGLGNVQKLRDGEPLGGGTTAKQDFGTPVQPVQQTYGQAPQQPQYGQPMPAQGNSQYGFLGM